MSTDLTYAVVLEPQPEGGFTVTVPALPEVVTEGDTEKEALEMAREAIELALEVRVEQGEEIPDPMPTVLRHVTVAVAA
jgi:antitoxin HicB